MTKVLSVVLDNTSTKMKALTLIEDVSNSTYFSALVWLSWRVYLPPLLWFVLFLGAPRIHRPGVQFTFLGTCVQRPQQGVCVCVDCRHL